MKPMTPSMKVLIYDVGMLLLGAGVVIFVCLSFMRPIAHHLYVYPLIAAFLFLTAFASSRSKFAKEVTLIGQFCDKRHCHWKDFPADAAAREAVRMDEGKWSISAELIQLVYDILIAEAEVKKFWLSREEHREEFAKEKEQKARTVFRNHWEIYQKIGVLPFKDPKKRIKWKDSTEFQESISLKNLLLSQEEDREDESIDA